MEFHAGSIGKSWKSVALEAELDQADSLRAQVFAGMQGMLKARRSHPALILLPQQEIPDAPPDLFLITRRAETERG